MMNTAAAGTSSCWPWSSSKVEALQAGVAAAADDPGTEPDGDVRGGLDLVDQIVRHPGGQGRAADEQGDVGGVLGQVEGGLACGVGPADDEYVLAGDGWRHHACRAVEDAGADQAIEFGNVEVAVGTPAARITARPATWLPSSSVST